MKKTIIGIAIMLSCSLGLSLVPVTPVSAATCKGSFLGIKAWYNGLECDKGNVTISRSPDSKNEKLKKYIWTIILNVSDGIFKIAGIVAVGFLIFGGYTWIFSGGVPEQVVKGRKTVTNAIVGLIISLVAVLVVNLVLGVFL
jgi:hypothetical protein